MTTNKFPVTTKVATLALPTREAHVAATVWPGPRGMLLFLAELNLAPQTRQEFLQKINGEIERVWQEVKLMPQSADEILETIIVPINNQLASSERLLGNPLSPRYQMLLAYLSGQKIALAELGLIDAFVISPNKLNNVLVASSQHRGRKQSGTFDNLISGELIPGENLLLATPALTDYFSWDRLRQLISDRAPGQALREIERYMLQLKTHPPLGLICLKMSLASDIESTDSSISHLLNTQAQTDSLLQPKLISYLKSKFTRGKATANKFTTTESTGLTKPITSTKEKPAGGLTLIFGKISRGFKRLAWLGSRESAKVTIAWWLEAKIIQWRRLAKSKRAILLLGLVILLAFSQSIVNLGRNRIKSVDSEYYNQLVTEITEKQAEIEGVLIYGDHDKALILFNEVKAKLEQLPHNTSSRQEQWQALQANLSLLARRLQYLNEVTNPEAWSQLPAPTNNQSWGQLAALGNQIIVIGSKDKLLTLSADGKVKDIISLPGELSNTTKTIPLQNDLLLINQDNKTGLYTASTNKISVLTQNLELQDGGWYQGGIYYLSQTSRTIWRAGLQGTTLASPTRWLRSSQGELPNAISLIVDGSIYVATATGVEKYNRGLKQDFNIAPVNPPLNAITKIYTASDTDYLYLWEKNNKRLVVYDKTGKLIIQITLPTLESTTAVAIDGVNKLLYVLSGNTIYRVPILAPVTR
ncbi:MAG TPA: hypothetical protein DIS54_02235 [Candidatus Veblenbacteria bacterium]|nr:hypothetical protein [Candidatus Veblenbacteria bacterium]